MKFEPKKIVLVGGGGHSRVVLHTLQRSKIYQIVGFVDKNLMRGTSVNGFQVLGDDEALEDVYARGCHQAFIAIGSVGDVGSRRRIFERLKALDFSLPSLVDSDAVVADSAQIAAGTYVAAGVVIQPGSRIGQNAIINTGAVVDHDCFLGDFVHLAPGSTLSGGVKVGEGTHIGTGSSVIEGVSIGRETIIGAGSVVVQDIPDFCKAFGNPCRVQERIK